MTGLEKKAMKKDFIEIVLCIIEDYDPDGKVTDTIKREIGMGFSKYLDGYAENFIDKLSERNV